MMSEQDATEDDADAAVSEARHAAKMAKKKVARDKIMATKRGERGLIIVHTGAGKGKSSSAFGMIVRCLAHGFPCAVVQFIKGAWDTGERRLLTGHFGDLCQDESPAPQAGRPASASVLDRRTGCSATGKRTHAKLVRAPHRLPFFPGRAMTVTLHVCITCRAGQTLAEGETTPGKRLHAAILDAGLPDGVSVVPVECLSACSQGWEKAKELILDSSLRMVVLDEINIALRYDYLDIAEVVAFLKMQKPPMTHVVLTGRNAKEELIEVADLVTEMTLVKHPFRSGIKAQAGVEF